MPKNAESQDRGIFSSRVIYVTLLILIVLLSVYFRFEGLGVRSLWRDELCTWHVSRMGLWEGLRWGPELTKPPLYQFALRLLTRDPHPSEAMLRFPAAACGVLTVLVGWWLGKLGGSRRVGVALASLFACNGLQIYYSQEGRPYSMLLLGCTLSTGLWYCLVTERRWRYFLAYIAVAVLTLHAHYLALLTIAGQAAWWMAVCWLRPTGRRSLRPLVALAATGLLCSGVVVRYLYFRSSMFQGLSWIEPPTWQSTVEVLGRLAFGWEWIFLVLAPASVLWVAGAFGLSLSGLSRLGGALFAGRNDLCGLLLACFACGWFGLLVISWVAHPAVTARYALPAGAPAMLIPLIMAYRLDRRAPLILMMVFVIVTAPDSISRGYAMLHPPQWRTDPGLRELAAYLQENVDPETEAAVLTLDAGVYPGWEDSERLIFNYYPINGVPVEELRLAADNVTAKNDILKDPRGLYLIVLWADPFPILEAAGRQPVPFQINGISYSRLLFTPYRLVRVAPLSQETQ